MRFLARITVFLFAAALIGFVATYFLLSIDVNHKNQMVFIPKRSSTEEIAEIFYDRGILSFQTPFVVASHINALNGRYIQPGEYEIEQGMNAHKILKKILSGDRFLRKVMVPEGYTVYQVKAVLDTSDGLIGEYLGYISEGYLMPETYHYYHGATKGSMIARMRDELQGYMDTVVPAMKPNKFLPGYHEILTLASIVEKEAVHDAERPIIASVYLNRLKIGMPLQADPTVIYGLKNGQTDFDYLLTKDDLKHDSPYNTYIYKGLPPNPICNPGKKSIDAVLNPADTDYLYFVANGENGGHNFSKSYRQHTLNVRSYRATR